jgi:hypothetical protein
VTARLRARAGAAGACGSRAPGARYPARVRVRALSLVCLCALGLGACGDTLQTQPIPHNILESLIISPWPVYWVGGSFQGLPVSEAAHDPGGAYRVAYGSCSEGGQNTCVTALSVITSPNNSFVPGGSLAHTTAPLRGVSASFLRGGRTIAIATGPVVVDIYAADARLALAAARTAVPINRVAAPESPLPPALAPTPFNTLPLPPQLPTAPRPLP